jgi:hypothetical protein
MWIRRIGSNDTSWRPTINKIWKPVLCASLLGAACSLPVQAHGPYTDNDSHSQQHAVHMDSGTTAMWNTGTSRDPMGLPSHGAWGTGSAMTGQAMMVNDNMQGGYRSAPGVAPQQPSYAPAPRTTQPGWSDDYRMRGY